MNRIDGYLDIDSYFNKKYGTTDTKKLIKAKAISESCYSHSHYWFLLDDGIYYFKDSGFSFREVITSYMAKDMGLNSLEYHMAEFHGERGVISKKYTRDDMKYITIDDVIIEFCIRNRNLVETLSKTPGIAPIDASNNNLELIWMALDSYFPKRVNEVAKIMENIVDIFIFKLIIRNSDALPYNIEIGFNDKEICIAPIFDNEYSLWPEQIDFPMKVSYESGHDYGEVLEEFLLISSEEFIARFLELYSYMTPRYIYELIDRLEKEEEYKLNDFNKNIIIMGYNKSIEIVDEVLKKLNIDHKRS